MKHELLGEELFHAQIDFFSFEGDVSSSYRGLISYRNCKTRDEIVLFIDFDKSSEKSRKLLDFFTMHQYDLNAHVTSIIGQKESAITCFDCNVVSVYRRDTKSLVGSCGKLVEINCNSWIENELINSHDDAISWSSASIPITGLHLFSGNNDDFSYSITFRIKGEIELCYSNLQSQIIMTTGGNYKLPISTANSSVNIKFIRHMPVKEIRNYVNSFMSFLRFIFGVEISFGPIICNDSSVECEDGITKINPSFWLKNSVRVKETFDTTPYINPIVGINALEENSDTLFDRWNEAYHDNPLSLTVMERINKNPVSDSEYVEDVALLTRAILQIVDCEKVGGKTPPNEVRIASAMKKINLSGCLKDSEKLAEVRNADSHSLMINTSIVSFEEMPRLRGLAIDLFQNYMKKCILML